MSDFSVSIVIPAFNESENLANVLQQIKNQDYLNIKEIIVVDNSSTDQTAQIAEELGAIVLLEKKKGTRFAYQTGMSHATGDIIAVTNADVSLPTNWISSMLKYYKDPNTVGVGTHIKFYNCPTYVNFFWQIIKYTGDIAMFLRIFGVKERTFWGASMSVRREIFHLVGGIDQSTDTNEDMLFTQSIRQKGKAPYIYDTVVLLDGRRYSGGIINAAKNWIKGIGLNSLFVLFTGHSKITTFEDVRTVETSVEDI